MAAKTSPPNYGPQQARFGPRCDLCAFFKEPANQCQKHGVPVKIYFSCDDWERDPDIPVRAV